MYRNKCIIQGLKLSCFNLIHLIIFRINVSESYQVHSPIRLGFTRQLLVSQAGSQIEIWVLFGGGRTEMDGNRERCHRGLHQTV